MYYVDAELAPAESIAELPASTPAGDGDARSSNFLANEFSSAADRFEAKWGNLPQFPLETGSPLRRGTRSDRVAQLRERLGLPQGDMFDSDLADRIREYRSEHGLDVSSDADNDLITALNRGHAYYARKVALNRDRLNEIPSAPGERFILVDAASQILYMYEGDRIAGTMKVVVGKESDPTPMMAGFIRYSEVRPYWNVPPDLTRRDIAPKVLAQGMPFLRRTGFQALSDWTTEAVPLDPQEVDWKAVANGDFDLRVRQLPGPGNGMGAIKFMFPNQLGIYLHDTPSKHLFDAKHRAFSAGCVRLEDADRLSRWLYGFKPGADNDEPAQIVHLDDPVPVYITYLTAASVGGDIEFREDFYGRDDALMSRVQADFLDF